MGENDNFSESKLLAEIERLKKSNLAPGETVFMRMLHELNVCQIEIEMHNRELREAHLELEVARIRYSNLYDFTPVLYFTFDRHGVILEANLSAAALLGKERSSLIGIPFVNFVAKHDRQNFIRVLQGYISGDALSDSIFSIDLQLDDLITLQVAGISMLNTPGGSVCFRMAFIDVTAQKLAELKFRLTSKVLENVQEGILLTDDNKKIILVNAAFTKVSGYAEEDVIGLTPSFLKSGRHDVEFYRRMNVEIDSNDCWQGEIWNRHKNGEIFLEWLSIKVIRNERGQIDCYIGIFSDIANQEKMKNRLYEMAYGDELTGLSNRSL